MRIEIPDCARCCACIPLRYGIIIFGYLNLGFNILMLAAEIWFIVTYESEYSFHVSMQASSNYLYRGVNFFSQTWFIVLLYSLEIVFNAVLLFGAHTKRAKLIRVYYYYGLTTCLAAFTAFVFVKRVLDYDKGVDYYLYEFAFAFSGLVLQVYLLLLIRSELKKLDNLKLNNSFINHAADCFTNQNDEERNPL